MEYYIYYLDIESLTRYDTAMCNISLRPHFLELCKQYIITSELYTISEYYKYIYLRGLKIANLIIFNNRQLQLFYRHMMTELNDMHITYLSISDCCIDNNIINYILAKLSRLKVLKIGIFKFTNCLFDQDNDAKYELSNIYSRLFLSDDFTYCVYNKIPSEDLQNVEDFNAKNMTFDFSNIIPLECAHDEYLLDECNIISSPELIPLKYAIDNNGSVTNIMNNIVGNIGNIDIDALPLEELHIHNTHNLTYSNIISLLKKTALKKLSLHICAYENTKSMLDILNYNIPVIEIVNKKLIFDDIIDTIITLNKKIKILKIYINASDDEGKIHLEFTTDEQHPRLISFTFWDLAWHIPRFKRLLLHCINIEELIVNTILVFDIIKACNVAELLKISLKTIQINYLDSPYFSKYVSSECINYMLS